MYLKRPIADVDFILYLQNNTVPSEKSGVKTLKWKNCKFLRVYIQESLQAIIFVERQLSYWRKRKRLFLEQEIHFSGICPIAVLIPKYWSHTSGHMGITVMMLGARQGSKWQSKYRTWIMKLWCFIILVPLKPGVNAQDWNSCRMVLSCSWLSDWILQKYHQLQL